MAKKIIIIVQARTGSTRFKNKVLKKLGKKTIIEFIVDNLKKSKKIHEVIVATTKNKLDDKLVRLLSKKKIKFFRGSEKNVLSRYYEITKKQNADIIVRVCGDCPFVDSEILDKMIILKLRNKYDYISNIHPPTFPDGFDIEIFTKKSLFIAFKKAKKYFDLEHVTPFIIKNAENKHNFNNTTDLSKYRLTIDEPIDYSVIKNVYNILNGKKISFRNISNLINNQPNIFKKNMSIKRNEGSKMSKGQKLWKKAKTLIPGGNMLLSKRPEMFLPNKWPTYFSKSKGCYVWSLENKKYLDFSTMSVGTNILGYANKDVDASVINAVKKGNMSSLNCAEEVELADRLIKMHPWFDMVRFAKTGGECNSIAIRIARAFSKKDNVAICGYHGWHDWYLSANLSSKKNLSTHLLPGLSPLGVPKKLINTVHPFEYNNIEKFYKICETKNIGVVKMEVFRNIEPQDNFLQKIRAYCTKKKIVLIFDECTSGFRETFGGLHKKYNIKPDMCILGKALGNGYPITVVMGKKKIMDQAQLTFISSTFWTERTGYAAALKSLEIMEKKQSWKKISEIGKIVKKKWKSLGEKYQLPITVFGLDAIPIFIINSKRWNKYKSFITSELLKNSILASNVIYLSTEHNQLLVDKYFKFLEKAFAKIKNFEDGKDLRTLKDVPTCHSGFKRLN